MKTDLDLNLLLREAHEFRRNGEIEKSREKLKQFLLHDNALLWLGNVSQGIDINESIAAAELALKLDPHNEMAQRAIKQLRSQEKIKCDRRESFGQIVSAIIHITGLTLNESRVVRWPFKKLNKPIGEALDQGLIDYRDLAWCATSPRVFDEKLRQAATNILLSHFFSAEPQKFPPPLRIIQGSRFLEIKERKSAVLFGLVGGFTLVPVLFLMINSILVLFSTPSFFHPKYLLCGMLVYLSIFVPIFSFLADRIMNLRLGRRGEDGAVEVFRTLLDGRWVLFRNFIWKNRKWGDVDLILVGPGGVWVFEVKTYSGLVRNDGDIWKKKKKFGWFQIMQNPGRQARANASRVKTFLDQNGINVGWVEAVVIFANNVSPYPDEQGEIIIRNPAIPVWELGVIPEKIEELWSKSSLGQEDVVKITDILEKAMEDGKKENGNSE